MPRRRILRLRGPWCLGSCEPRAVRLTSLTFASNSVAKREVGSQGLNRPQIHQEGQQNQKTQSWCGTRSDEHETLGRLSETYFFMKRQRQRRNFDAKCGKL